MIQNVVHFKCRNCGFEIIWHNFDLYGSTRCPECNSKNTHSASTDQYFRMHSTSQKELYKEISAFVLECLRKEFNSPQISAMVRARFDDDINADDIR